MCFNLKLHLLSNINNTYNATIGAHKKEKLKNTTKIKSSNRLLYDKKLTTKSLAEQMSEKASTRFATMFCFLNPIKKASANRLKIERMFSTDINV